MRPGLKLFGAERMLVYNEITLSFVTAMAPWIGFYTALGTFVLSSAKYILKEGSLIPVSAL